MTVAHRKDRAGVDAHEKIRKAIFVDVARGCAPKRSLIIQTNFLCDIAKSSIAHIAKQPRRIRAWQQEQVDVATIIKICRNDER